MFEHKYELRFSDYIDFERTKPSALLDIVQDIAILHSDSLGFGMPALRERGLIWMMQGIKMHIACPALPRVDIKASTCPVGFKGVSSDRGTILEQNGKVFAKAVVSWFIFDLEKHTLGKIPADIASGYPIHDFGDPFFRYRKPLLPDEMKPLYTIRVTNRDLDVNGHLNNQKSAEMLLAALPLDFDLTDLNITYKKEVYAGSELSVCRCETEHGYAVALVNENGEICVAGIFENI